MMMDMEIFDLLVSTKVAFFTDGNGNITLRCDGIRKLLEAEHEATKEIEKEEIKTWEEIKPKAEVKPEKTKKRKPIDKGKVIALHNAGWKNTKIADEMGCAESTVSMILKGVK